MALRQRLRRRLGREARRAAAVLGRVAQQIDPPPDPVEPGVREDGGGPPEHWLAVVRARAPQLLEGRGIGARVADRAVSRAAMAEEGDFTPLGAPADRRAAFDGGAHPPGPPADQAGRWPASPAGRPAAAGRWDEPGPSHHPVDGPPALAARADAVSPTWEPAPANGPLAAPDWPALAPAPPAAAPAGWPVPPGRPPAPDPWADPAVRGAPATPAPAARGPEPVAARVPAAVGWPDPWPAVARPGAEPAPAAPTPWAPLGPVATHPTPVAGAATVPVAFADEGGWWPDLPALDDSLVGSGPAAPAGPAHGPFDRARIARLDAEQSGRPAGGAR
jgi:hypothetical protein